MAEAPSQNRRQFASDNWAGMCPEALASLTEANAGHVQAYGEDAYTRRACDLLREFFETDCEVYFTFTGTAANSLALASLCRNYHSIICHEFAHVETDECGAPEFFSNGTKVLLAPGEHGKLNLAEVGHLVTKRADIHYPKPKVLSLSQATELGTVYTPGEIEAAADLARRHRLKVHMDGARFANALATLGVSPRALSWEAGVDVLCLGGAKNGLPVGDAVIFFDREPAAEFDYRCKQAGQLASKMRFLSAPWIGMLEHGALLAHAARANHAAALLETELRAIPGVAIKHPRQANSVFVTLPVEWAGGLRDRGWAFYQFIGEGGIRLMCSWDTAEDDVHAFMADLRAVAGTAPVPAESQGG